MASRPLFGLLVNISTSEAPYGAIHVHDKTQTAYVKIEGSPMIYVRAMVLKYGRRYDEYSNRIQVEDTENLQFITGFGISLDFSVDERKRGKSRSSVGAWVRPMKDWSQIGRFDEPACYNQKSVEGFIPGDVVYLKGYAQVLEKTAKFVDSIKDRDSADRFDALDSIIMEMCQLTGCQSIHVADGYMDSANCVEYKRDKFRTVGGGMLLMKDTMAVYTTGIKDSWERTWTEYEAIQEKNRVFTEAQAEFARKVAAGEIVL